MGYRSHVLFSITEPVDVEARLLNPAITNLLGSADKVHIKKWSDGELYYIYEWDAVKWYDSYIEIRALMDWMDEREDSCDTEDEYGFMFLRDGEEMNDLEHHGGWNMGITYGIGIEHG